MDPKGISQYFMLSLKCPILLLLVVLSILSHPIYNIFLLCSTPPPLVLLDSIIQRGRNLYLKILQKEYQ